MTEAFIELTEKQEIKHKTKIEIKIRLLFIVYLIGTDLVSQTKIHILTQLYYFCGIIIK